MILTFDTHGNDKQKQVARYWCDRETTEIAYGGSKASGKSFLGCSLIFGDALMYPGTHYFIARRELNDLRKHTIPSIHEVLDDIWKLKQRYYKFHGQDNYFTLYNNSRVYLLAASYLPSDPEYARFGSMQMTRGWIEEGGENGFKTEAKDNLSASIGRWKNDIYNLQGKLLITCNPSKNFLYSDFYEPNKKGTLPTFRKFVQALPQDNKKSPPGYLEHLQNTLSENAKQRLLHGNWEYDDDPTVLCEIVKINDIFTNTFVKPGEKVITCDVARMGKNSTVSMVWDGWRVVEYVEMPRSRTSEVVTLVKRLQSKYNIPASAVIVDEDGIGGGVVDYCPGSVGFIANHTPIYIPGRENESYGTLKDQCGWWLSDRVNGAEMYAGVIEGKHREFATQELEQLKAKEIDHDGKNRLVSKDVIKQNIGRSPDFLDNFIMRSYFDILKRTQRSRFVGAR